MVIGTGGFVSAPVVLAAALLRKLQLSTTRIFLHEANAEPGAMIKACGLAQFGADIYPEGAVELAGVHSTEHHAIIKAIDTSEAAKMPGVIGIMTGKDVPGTNRIRVMAPDQPVICEERVRMYGDPVAVVAAETRAQARAAAAKVKVTYEPLPVMLEPEEALAEGAPQIHPHSPNLLAKMPLIKGDVKKALKESKTVIEAEFSTQMNHQAPLEPETSVAYLEGEGKDAELVIYGRSIQIHGHKDQLKEALGFENVRYREPYSGGQFGIKAAITSEAIAGAAALFFKRPVRYIPSLEESMWLTTKRHPFKMKVALGADAENRINAYNIEMLVNKGAYTILGPIPISRAMHMLSGSYYIPNINMSSELVYTNNSPGGAARGAGPPQANYALECAVDMLAEKAAWTRSPFGSIIR
jgi:aldehyde oxidoreductase